MPGDRWGESDLGGMKETKPNFTGERETEQLIKHERTGRWERALWQAEDVRDVLNRMDEEGG